MTIASPPPNLLLHAERRVVLEGVSWSLYEKMLAELGDRRGVRLTYDRGRLEIMSPSRLHENVKKIAARLLEAYSDAVEVRVEGCGSWTLNREDLEKGLEPDECYYVQSVPLIAGKGELDLAVDPPPDLAIEVDISPPDVAKQPIYAALGVPEVWRYDGRRMAVMLRTATGTYAESDRSLALPDLPMDEFNRFIEVGLAKGQYDAVRAMRRWLRSRPESSRQPRRRGRSQGRTR